MPTIYVSDKDSLPKRAKHDLYVTEPSIVQIACQKLISLQDIEKPIKSILDVGAGDGRWGQIAKSYNPEARLTGVDIRDVRPKYSVFDEWIIGDYLTQALDHYDLIVGNPPFAHSEEFVVKAFSELKNGGWLLFFLPIEFQCSVARYENLWSCLSPVHIMLMSRRPSFYNNATGGSEFGVYFWHKTKLGLSAGVPRSWNVSIALHTRGQYE